MAIHFYFLAWEIPQTEEPGGLQFELDTTQRLNTNNGNFIFRCSRNLLTVFLQWLHRFTFLPTVKEGSFFLLIMISLPGVPQADNQSSHGLLQQVRAVFFSPREFIHFLHVGEFIGIVHNIILIMLVDLMMSPFILGLGNLCRNFLDRLSRGLSIVFF